MIEQLAAAVGRPVSRETSTKLQHYVGLLLAENQRQNLISASTAEQVWERHILDSAQLAGVAPEDAKSWVDVGSGAGLPGIVIALLVDAPVTLVEPRRLRAEFLVRTAQALGIADRVMVAGAKVERVAGSFDVITARAVAALPRLLSIACHLSHAGTVWLLPKGRSAKSELAEAQRSWHCHASSKRSITDPESEILVLSRVGAKSRR